MQCFYLTLLSFGLLLLRVAAQEDCTGLPMDSDVRTSFNSLLINQGGEGGGTFTIRDGPFYTCQAQGSTMGTYRQVSVVMTYTRNSASSTTLIRQFELDCIDISNNLIWTDRSGSLSTPGNGFDYMNSLRTDCAECVTSMTPPNENHCQPCDSACNSGLMRCTGISNSDCCVAFDNGVCSVDLDCTETNFVANEQNNFTCKCGLTCDPGFTVNSTNCLSCFLSNICLTDMHNCQNGGQCVLNSAPDNFTCSCTGTGFTGPNYNCTDPIASPSTTVSSQQTSTASRQATTSSVSTSSTTTGSISTSPPSSITGTESTTVFPQSPVVSSMASQSSRVEIPAIVVSAVLGFIVLVALVITIIYMIYYWIASGKSPEIKKSTPFSNGESYTNPMYINPDELTQEVNSKTT